MRGNSLVQFKLFVVATKLGQLVLREEPNFPSLDNESVFREIDTRLMTFQHVQSKEQLDVSPLALQESEKKKKGKQKGQVSPSLFGGHEKNKERRTSMMVKLHCRYRSVPILSCAL